MSRLGKPPPIHKPKPEGSPEARGHSSLVREDGPWRPKPEIFTLGSYPFLRAEAGHLGWEAATPRCRCHHDLPWVAAQPGAPPTERPVRDHVVPARGHQQQLLRIGPRPGIADISARDPEGEVCLGPRRIVRKDITNRARALPDVLHRPVVILYRACPVALPGQPDDLAIGTDAVIAANMH